MYSSIFQALGKNINHIWSSKDVAIYNHIIYIRSLGAHQVHAFREQSLSFTIKRQTPGKKKFYIVGQMMI